MAVEKKADMPPEAGRMNVTLETAQAIAAALEADVAALLAAPGEG